MSYVIKLGFGQSICNSVGWNKVKRLLSREILIITVCEKKEIQTCNTESFWVFKNRRHHFLSVAASTEAEGRRELVQHGVLPSFAGWKCPGGLWFVLFLDGSCYLPWRTGPYPLLWHRLLSCELPDNSSSGCCWHITKRTIMTRIIEITYFRPRRVVTPYIHAFSLSALAWKWRLMLYI